MRAWRLPPGSPEWPAGASRETSGATLLAPNPTPAQAARLVEHLAGAAGELGALPVREVVATLGAVGRRFLDEGDGLRQRALEGLPPTAGISPPQARLVLDEMARDWTPEALTRVLEADFADPEVLDEFRPVGRQRLRALPLGNGTGPGVHVCSGTVPGVSLTSLLRGLLVKRPILLKPGAGDVLLPLLFLEGLHETGGATARTLASSSSVTWWPGGEGGALEEAALSGASCLVVYGGDDTVAELRHRAAPGTPVVGYPHRVSVAVAGVEDAVATGRALADAVAAYDQRGCVSPQHAFVIGPHQAALAVAEATASALDALDRHLPPGPTSPAEAAAVQQLRGTAELRAAGGEKVHLLRGPGTRWTVVLDPETVFRTSCLSRTVHLTPLPEVAALREPLRPVGRYLQTVGTGGLAPPQLRRVAELAAELGASRIAPLEAMAFPGPGWRHDGRGPLQRLVRWCGWEEPDVGTE